MATNYEIKTQTPKVLANPAGGFTNAVEIAFVTKPSEQVGRVTIAEHDYNADAVDELVRARAALIEQVQHL